MKDLLEAAAELLSEGKRFKDHPESGRLRTIALTLLKFKADKKKVDDLLEKARDAANRLEANAMNLDANISKYTDLWMKVYAGEIKPGESIDALITSSSTKNNFRFE